MQEVLQINLAQALKAIGTLVFVPGFISALI